MATFISFLFLLLLPCANSISFQKLRFDGSDASIVYEGAASSSVGAIELNSRSYSCQVGRATYIEKVPLRDSNTNKLADFTTSFSFFIDTGNRTNYSSGITFFLAPYGFHTPTNAACGFLGLYNITTKNTTHNQIVHIEFDTVPEPEWDPPVQHAGINIGSISSATYTYWNSKLHDNDNADVQITYNGSTKNLSLNWKYQTTSTPDEITSLSYIVDLKEILPQWVQVGFSSATCNFVERHVVQSWEFSSSLDLQERTKSDADRAKQVAFVTVAGGLALIVAVAIAFGILRKRKKMVREPTNEMSLASINNELERGAGPRRFSYEDLVSATNNFSNDRILGKGEFGAVYRGYLIELDMVVAVKKFQFSKSANLGRKEYITEVKIISQLRHRNLVQLIGWCHDRGEFLLVYEFVPNGSLDTHLFGKKIPLTWAVRYRIVLGLASALLYLHEEWEQCVVHRDIRSSNILLDSSFNVKLGVFGLAQLMDPELVPEATELAGYMAPEYMKTLRASKESDVHSFGMVVLEIVTGRNATGLFKKECQMSLKEWIWDLYGAGTLNLAVDQKIRSEFDEKQFECLMIVGLWCAHPDFRLRPSVRQAIQVLKFEAILPSLPTKMPPVPVYDGSELC